MAAVTDDGLLGDPSGQANAQYWDQWFNSICLPTGRSFEWYTGPMEVERILSLHMSQKKEGVNKNITSVFENARIIHPGSGNSLLPIYLRDKYPTLHQSVVDCSHVAIREMQTRHDKLYQDNDTPNPLLPSYKSCRIDYVVSDLLENEPPLAYEDQSFHAWIDKGFIDALFGSFGKCERRSCRRLLKEANRMLSLPKTNLGNKNETSGVSGGICVVITLAQEHSLKLILDGIDDNNDDGLRWSRTVHVHELEPLQKGASSLCPFGFVLEKTSIENDKSKSLRPAFVFHRRKGEDEIIPFPDVNDRSCNFSSMFEAVHEKLDIIRSDFAATFEEDQNRNAEEAPTRMLLASIHIKPSSDYEMTSLDLLSQTIMNRMQYKSTFPSLTWKTSKIVPIGFGISKLVFECLVDAESLDDLIEAILDVEGEERVQSVDVDWESTVPVGDAMKCLSKLNDSK